MGKKIDMTGQRFGRLVVIEEAERDNNRRVKWLCKCDCGKNAIVQGAYLRNGHTKSCGCYMKDRASEKHKVHGRTETRLYNIWIGIKQRTLNEHSKDYPNYGGRGITICDEWRNSFQNFYDWAMESGYRENLTIDRIDNNGNYEPCNCKWKTPREQANNRRTNIVLEYKGERKTLREWAEETGIYHETIRQRLRTGWTIEKALTTPSRQYRRKNEGLQASK